MPRAGGEAGAVPVMAEFLRWLARTSVGSTAAATGTGPGAAVYPGIGDANSALRRGQFGRDDDVPLLDLAGRPLGQRVDDPHVARVLVGRDLALDVVPQFLRGDGRPGLEGHRGGDLLAEGGVRQAD